MNLGKTVVGVDTAKRVFQLHWIEQETGEIERRLKVWLKEDVASKRIAEIPGVGLLALANKMARTIWALRAHERAYRPGFVSQPA
jgi:hypothetical protein